MVCRVNAIIPPAPQNSAQGFIAAFPAIVPAQLPTIPDRQKRILYRLRHTGGHTRARTHSTDTRYHRHAGTLYRSAQTAYYNKVYKRAGHASPAGQLLPCADCWQVLTHCQQYRPGAPAEGSASPPVQGQPGGWRSGTWSAVRAGSLAPSTRRGSPAVAGARQGGAEPLAALAAALFGLSPDN